MPVAAQLTHTLLFVHFRTGHRTVELSRYGGKTKWRLFQVKRYMNRLFKSMVCNYCQGRTAGNNSEDFFRDAIVSGGAGVFEKY